ncbi:unnamed protein product [Darwinula stevensoni]|uniref:PARP-type domain-containing protein n=1 Tax=Darwinula stevensoni TaxID=69355 RepID=A0A7R8X8A3_9CRUS|nr:unnamed protein product [Darwinula stevensoni]CAG0883144.1 unnamed protein product [Darwinula stevensoni]
MHDIADQRAVSHDVKKKANCKFSKTKEERNASSALRGFLNMFNMLRHASGLQRKRHEAGTQVRNEPSLRSYFRVYAPACFEKPFKSEALSWFGTLKAPREARKRILVLLRPGQVDLYLEKMADDLPYRAEYAKSNRSSCKGCRGQIVKDSLRLAIMVQSPMFDGKQPNWHHVPCFFEKQRPHDAADFSHFEQLRWEDQETIRKKIESAGSAKEKGGKSKVSPGTNLKDFTVEYAKSSRSTCISCESKIEKGEVRIAKKDYESDSAKRFGPMNRWHHVDCFVKDREELEYFDSGAKLQGFKTLSAEDQAELQKKLSKMDGKKRKAGGDAVDGAGKKKPKLEGTKEEDSMKETLKKQNEVIFKYRDWLKKELSKKDLTLLFEYNQQETPKGEDSMLDRLGDIMAFGALHPCDVCKNGQLVFRSGVGYQCLGNLTEWTKCTNITDNPKRKPFKIPPELAEEYSLLKKYKGKVGKREFVHSNRGVTKVKPERKMETRQKRDGAVNVRETVKFSAEQKRVILLYHFRSGLKPQQAFEEMKKNIGDDAPGRTMVFKWFQRFEAGHFEVTDDPRSGRPRTSTDDGMVAAVAKFLEEEPSATTKRLEVTDDPRSGRPRTSTDDGMVAAVAKFLEEEPSATTKRLADVFQVSKTSISSILHDQLDYSKKSARWVPRLLKPEEKEARVNFCKKFLEDFEDGNSPNFRKIITVDNLFERQLRF